MAAPDARMERRAIRMGTPSSGIETVRLGCRLKLPEGTGAGESAFALRLGDGSDHQGPPTHPRPLANYIRDGYSRRMASSHVEPAELLPLTPVVLHVLLTLSEGERHGYSIAQEIET